MSIYSKMRKQLGECAEEYFQLTQEMMRPGKMVRGTIYWHRTAEGKERKEYPNLSRTVHGVASKRSVKLKDVKWLKELLDKYRLYRLSQKRLRELHRTIIETTERLRYEKLYDYEPLMPEQGSLKQAKWEKEHGA